jgi:hypothetical protein
MGNILVQAMCLGELDNLKDIREVVCRSGEVAHFEPAGMEAWDMIYHERFLPLKTNETDNR